jgi:hypothetical protein
LFYGGDILNQPESKLTVNSEDVLLINIVKTDNTIPSKIQLSVEIL